MTRSAPYRPTTAAASAARRIRSLIAAAAAKAAALGPTADRGRPVNPPGKNNPQLSMSIERTRTLTTNMPTTIQIACNPSTGARIPTTKNAETASSDSASAEAFHDGTNDSSAVEERTTRTWRSGRDEGGKDTAADNSAGIQRATDREPGGFALLWTFRRRRAGCGVETRVLRIVGLQDARPRSRRNGARRPRCVDQIAQQRGAIGRAEINQLASGGVGFLCQGVLLLERVYLFDAGVRMRQMREDRGERIRHGFRSGDSRLDVAVLQANQIDEVVFKSPVQSTVPRIVFRIV